MNVSRFILAVLIATAFLATVHLAIEPSLFPNGPAVRYAGERAQPMRLFHAAATMIAMVVLAYLFPRYRRAKKPWVAGLRFGMLMGTLVSLPSGLEVYGRADVEVAVLLTGVMWTVITWGIAGVLIAFSYGNAEG
jgi:hypothetical protein